MDREDIQGAASGKLQAHYQTGSGANEAQGTKGKEAESGYPRTADELFQEVKPRLDFTIKGTLGLELHGRSLPTSLRQRMKNVIDRFQVTEQSSFIFMEAPAYHPEAEFPLVTVAANDVIRAAVEAGLPTIRLFCDALPSSLDSRLRDTPRTPKPPILGLVYYLIAEIVKLCPRNEDLGPIITFSELAFLNAKSTSWPIALDLFSKLFELPTHLVCVVDNFHAITGGTEYEIFTREFMDVLWEAVNVQKNRKILFTNSKPTFDRLRDMPWPHAELVEGVAEVKLEE